MPLLCLRLKPMDRNLRHWLSVLGLFLVLSLLNGGQLFYFVFFVILGVLLLSLAIVKSNVKQLVSGFYINERVVHVGDPLWIEYKLANNGLLPIMMAWVHIQVSKKLGNMTYAPQVLFFKPLQMITLKKDLVASHRGYYQVGSLLVSLTDPFMLYKKEVTYGKDIDLIVYPKVTELSSIHLRPSEFFGNIKVSENTHEDFTSIRNIRSYQYGDSIKRIHWKQSAKHDHVMVKEFDLSANMKVSIILDGYKGNRFISDFETIEEKMVEICASLSKYFLRCAIETRLLLTAKSHVRLNGKNMDRLEDILKELIGFDSDGELDIYKVFSSETKKLTYGSSLYVLTPAIDDLLVDAFIAAARKSIRVTVIHVLNRLEDSKKMRGTQEMLSTYGVQMHIIEADQDIRQVLEASP